MWSLLLTWHFSLSWTYKIDHFFMLIVSLAMMELVSLQVSDTSLGVERQRHVCRPLPGQPPHPWPLLMPTVDTHRKTFLRMLRHSLPSAACQEVHNVMTQTARSLSVEALRLSCPRQSLPGYPRRATLPPAVTQCMLNEEQAEMLCAPFPLFHLLIFIPSMHASILYMKVNVKAASYIKFPSC